MKISCQGTDHYGNNQTQYCSSSFPHGTAADYTGNPSCDSGAGVYFSDQYIRGFSGHNIPEYASAHTGEYAYKDKKERIVLGQDPGGSLNPHYCKNTKPCSVASEHDLVIIAVFDPGMKDFRVGIYDSKKESGG